MEAYMPTITSKRCPKCKETVTRTVTAAQLSAYNNGAHIQDAFPQMSADDRERFITGYCPKCWDKMFKEDRDDGQ